MMAAVAHAPRWVELSQVRVSEAINNASSSRLLILSLLEFPSVLRGFVTEISQIGSMFTPKISEKKKSGNLENSRKKPL